MAEESWHHARLIPTSGIGGAEEQERRATSALLAVLGIVPEFSRALLGPLGAPVREVTTYVEVPFELDGKKVIPDGLIRVRRGSKEWTALVEVKTGKNPLRAEQLENYLDVARTQAFDALITISNEIPPLPGQHPTAVDKRKLRRVAMHHWSWSYVLSTAIVQKEHRGIADPEQAWILGELIRYLEHDRSGALELDDMGPNWVTVRESVAAGTLRQNDKFAPEVAARFDALLQYASLRLGQRLGTEVAPVISRQEAQTPQLRIAAHVGSLVQAGEMSGAIRIPHAVAPVTITTDLRAGKVTCAVEIGAPQEGRPTTRVNWLLRQLREARPDLLVESFAARARSGNAQLLRHVRDDPKLLAPDAKDIRTFRVALSMPLGNKRGGGTGSFVDSVLKTLEQFYGDVVENLKPWSAAPPKLRDADVKDVEPPALATTALSSQDGASA